MPAMTEAAQVGKRQEILDKIFNVEADKTPFLSSLRVGKRPEQFLANWVAEIYPAAPSTGTLDNTAATSPARVDRYSMTGCAQLFRRQWGTGTLADLTNVVGAGRDEAGKQMAAAMMLVKRMIETQFLSADDCAVESSPTPWTTRGVLTWLQNGAQGTYPVDTSIRPAAANFTTSAMASLTETVFRACLASAFDETKAPLNLVGHVGIDLKAVFDDFTNVYPVASTTSQPRTVYQVRDNSTFQSMVDRLAFSEGNVTLVLNPWIAFTTSTGVKTAYTPKSGVFLDMEMWDIGWIAKPANTNLAKDGAGTKGYIDAAALLRCLNPRGQVKVYSNS
jgi:hypothetical protein